MTTDLSRRNLAKGVAWSMPVVAVATAAPALAASCTPSTVTKNATLIINSPAFTHTDTTGSLGISSTGTDAAPAGTLIDFNLNISFSDDYHDATATFASSPNASITSSVSSGVNTNQTDQDGNPTPDTGYVTYKGEIKLTQDLNPGDVLTLSYTLNSSETPSTISLSSLRPHGRNPQTITTTSADGCVTTTTNVSISGSGGGVFGN